MDFRVDNLAESGITNKDLIARAQITSLSRADITDLFKDTHLRFDSDEVGYKIPYFDMDGHLLPGIFNVRLCKGAQAGNGDHARRIKYLKPADCKNHLYIPPGFKQLCQDKDWFILTEGEKKSLKAAQEGIPCVAISGVWNWVDSDKREAERLQGRAVKYTTAPVKELLDIGRKHKCLIVFDSDAAYNPHVKQAAYALRDSLLYAGCPFVRVAFVPMHAHKDFIDSRSAIEGKLKLGIDDWMVQSDGIAELCKFAESESVQASNGMSPLFSFVYDTDADGKPLSYYIPNYPPTTKRPLYPVMRTVEVEQGKDEKERVLLNEVISRTRIWVNSVVPSIDDNSFFYEMGYVPLSQNEVCYVTGGSELLNLSGRNGADQYARLGAQIITKDRANMEEFWHACQTHGVPGAVRRVHGTQRRGWVEYGDKCYYVSSGRVFDHLGNVFASENRNIPLLPLDGGQGDANFKKANHTHGSEDIWRKAIMDTVLNNPIPSLVMAGGLASLLRYWCPESENFVFHLYGNSTAGKTTSMEAAASLWGMPNLLIDRWSATKNGVGSMCVARNHSLLILDESHQADDPETPSKAVYLVGNGSEKIRATQTGGAKASTKFEVVLLSTGENAILSAQRNAGEEVRALEVAANKESPLWGASITNSEQAERFSTILKNNYGFGSVRAVSFLLKKEAEQKGFFHSLHKTNTALLRDTLAADAPPHIRRRVKHYGLLMTAAYLLLAGSLELGEEELAPFLKGYNSYISRNLLRNDTDRFLQSEDKTMLETFQQNITRLMPRHFTTPDRSALTGEYFGDVIIPKGKTEPTRLKLLPAGMAELCHPFDENRVIAMLHKNGIFIETDSSRKRGDHKSSVRFMLGNVTTAYTIDLLKLQAFVAGEDAPEGDDE